jgi:hypothetical protein
MEINQKLEIVYFIVHSYAYFVRHVVSVHQPEVQRHSLRISPAAAGGRLSAQVQQRRSDGLASSPARENPQAICRVRVASLRDCLFGLFRFWLMTICDLYGVRRVIC